MKNMSCQYCGEDLYRIDGLHYDRDGIRDARFCATCGIVYGVHAAGYSKQFQLFETQKAHNCPACSGTGTITCPACHGKGKLIKKEKK